MIFVKNQNPFKFGIILFVSMIIILMILFMVFSEIETNNRIKANDYYKNVLEEGFNEGFISGNQYGQGKVISYYQNQGYDLPYGMINRSGFTSKTTWYYEYGYKCYRCYIPNPHTQNEYTIID